MTYIIAKSFSYKGSDLVEISHVDGYEGSKTYNNLDVFEYDNMGRLTKEISINSFIGLTGKFQSNSTVLDSLYYKGEATKSVTAYQYFQDSIVAAIYDDKNKLRGYKLTKLNSDKKPILIVDTDPQGNKIKSVSTTYDNKKRLIEQRTKIIDIDKIDYDLLAGDSYQIIYNDKGLPIIELTKEKEKLISKWTLRYE